MMHIEQAMSHISLVRGNLTEEQLAKIRNELRCAIKERLCVVDFGMGEVGSNYCRRLRKGIEDWQDELDICNSCWESECGE